MKNFKYAQKQREQYDKNLMYQSPTVSTQPLLVHFYPLFLLGHFEVILDITFFHS